MKALSFLFRAVSVVFCVALLGLGTRGAAEDQKSKDQGQETRDDAQEFVFLGEARPVLVRLHVQMDGKPLQAAWDDFMKHLFDYLDVNGDGVLSKEEAERAPSVEQILGGAARGFGGGGRGGAAGPTMDALDADKDGKVTLAELSAYYRKHGFAPFQFKFGSDQGNPLAGAAAFLGGSRPEPSVAAISEAIFNLLDTNKDGKLTREKLAAAPEVLLRMDEDEDEIVTTRELVPNAEPAANPFAGLMAMGRPGAQDGAARSKHLVPIATPGEVPVGLVRTMQERYGPKAKKPEEKKLNRKDLALDEETFAHLDANGDGVLDAEELAGFVKRSPDLTLVIRLGKRGPAEARIEIKSGPGKSSLAGKLQITDGLGLLDLGATRLDFMSNEENPPDRFAGLVRDQYLAQFKQADTEGKGFITEAQAQKIRLFRGMFKGMDRAGDGKVTEKELNAYLDHLQEMQQRATAACVTLDLSDQSRGLFDLLDTNRDGRLSVREMRGAVKLLDQLDREGKGFLTREDIPHSYRLTLRPGSLAAAAQGPAAFFDLYRTADQAAPERPGRGPLWFRKMDRNRDGDVSRKEWLFSEDLFRKIDTDGDGLISVEEAETYDALIRKQGKQDR